jgi:hypothetical protein
MLIAFDPSADPLSDLVYILGDNIYDPLPALKDRVSNLWVSGVSPLVRV